MKYTNIYTMYDQISWWIMIHGKKKHCLSIILKWVSCESSLMFWNANNMIHSSNHRLLLALLKIACPSLHIWFITVSYSLVVYIYCILLIFIVTLWNTPRTE